MSDVSRKAPLSSGRRDRAGVDSESQRTSTRSPPSRAPTFPSNCRRSSDRGPRDLLARRRVEPSRPAAQTRSANALPALRSLKIDPSSSSYDYLKARYYEIEFHRRFALPAACLVLALVGIPLGLSARKGGSSAGFVLTILLVFVYYLFSLVGVSLARQGKVSPVARSLGWQHLFLSLRTAICSGASIACPSTSVFSAGIWDTLRGWSSAIGEHLPGSRGNRWAGATTRRRRKRFSARFPLILDDMILRDFAMYLVDDHGDLPDSGAGLHLLRVADRHRSQQGFVHPARRLPAEPQPLADLPDGADVCAAGGADHLRSDGESQRTDRHESHWLQHLPRYPSRHRSLWHLRHRSIHF